MWLIQARRHYYSPTDKSQILKKIQLQSFDKQVAEVDLISFSHAISPFAEEGWYSHKGEVKSG